MEVEDDLRDVELTSFLNRETDNLSAFLEIRY